MQKFANTVQRSTKVGKVTFLYSPCRLPAALVLSSTKKHKIVKICQD